MLHRLRNLLRAGMLSAAILLCFAPAAHADAGVPMLPVQYPQILLFIFPIILIETAYLRWQLGTLLRRTTIAVSATNLFTVALGYPLAWLIYQGLNAIIGFPPGENDVFGHLWQLPMWVAVKVYPGWLSPQQQIGLVLFIYLILLAPGYFLSGMAKRWLMDWYDLLAFKGSTQEAVWNANRYSYIFLAVVGCVLLYRAYAPM